MAIDIEDLKKRLAEVPVNPAKLDFPQDTWGFTSEVRKAVVKAAGNVRGQEDKHDLLISTLTLLVAHIKARYEHDVEDQKRRKAEAVEAAKARHAVGR